LKAAAHAEEVLRSAHAYAWNGIALRSTRGSLAGCASQCAQVMAEAEGAALTPK
jgi:hypothetical protein